MHKFITFVASIELTAGEHTVSVIRHNQLGFSLYMDAIKLVKIGGTQSGNSGNENQGGNSGSQGNENQGGNTETPVEYVTTFASFGFVPSVKIFITLSSVVLGIPILNNAL